MMNEFEMNSKQRSVQQLWHGLALWLYGSVD